MMTPGNSLKTKGLLWGETVHLAVEFAMGMARFVCDKPCVAGYTPARLQSGSKRCPPKAHPAAPFQFHPQIGEFVLRPQARYEAQPLRPHTARRLRTKANRGAPRTRPAGLFRSATAKRPLARRCESLIYMIAGGNHTLIERKAALGPAEARFVEQPGAAGHLARRWRSLALRAEKIHSLSNITTT